MTRQELINAITETVEIDKKTCGEVVARMLEEIYKALDKDGKYAHQGFGSFETRISAERIGINPSTKQRMRYPKKRKVRFKVSKLFKDTVNEN